ncbi:PREDICTED: uncharacterized protein LOC106124450 [Papilio xuthus]|uniref:Uncharacterized protein LOC106124450 n=2 Tax=Papilio xuthus TaxID=66420 RepID=A0AAJ7EGJ0_PAPXU|nr:PREDICTED: uncharacterized protein LOC106124450 [Papilio xuthus]XP_013176578.1 PREDICTED: uncharacterized protein LOC106124450 [Papilio xuthus]XP_013176579.1 PREDICTED: uncharacterized protein LOC106124450 [Papilio xuthus]XP_013176580.1 PREDICTED: uncharacterized protein LOC106124450 [Papilio xuthus]
MPLLNNNETNLPTTSYIIENSSCNLESLYCTHLWSNSSLRRTIINAPITDNKITKYCSSCRGKIRNYKLKNTNENFTPKSYSTPREKFSVSKSETKFDDLEKITCCDEGSLVRNISENEIANLNKTIPTISEDIDSGIQHKFRCTSFDTTTSNPRQGRLRKSLKGIGCFVDLTQSSIKKRTQLQVCSISIMILAIVIISLILVNFTHHETQATNIISTNAVPTKNIDLNEIPSATASIYSELPLTATVRITEFDTTLAPFTTTAKNISYLSNILTKIRKNIKTYPKQGNKTQLSFKINNDSTTGANITQKFCECQKNEVCMLEESSGTSLCLIALDPDDPTGCGGLCALETEACHLVDKARGVRVCRPLGAAACAARQWRCKNGFCVSEHARCNGSIECYDRSDEMYCDCDLTKEFRCGQSISCFPKAKLCDGAIDCWDGLDEINCTPECPDYQFTCTNGECIASSRFCDGLADCSDHSDEPTGCDGGCNAHEIRCSNKRCIPRLLRCDGRDDCGDNSDELHCP